MQTKNLVVWNYNSNMFIKNIRNFNSLNKIKVLTILLLFLLSIFSFTLVTHFYNALNNPTNKNLSVADFKSDINILSQIADIIESERKSDKNSQINSFGSDGKIIKVEEITPDLKAFLTNIIDKDNNGAVSNDEINTLNIMRLDQYTFQKKLNEFHFALSSMDRNFKNYIVITNGKYAGTVLYNGPLKFIDSDNKQYLGL